MNPFEELAILASEEEWCWNLCCTTCGHTHFKYAFREIAKGNSPNNTDWIIRKRKTRYQDELGQLPRQYSAKEKERFLEIASKASLSTISDKCTFPDWLGYLGLVLHHMRSSQANYKTLSMNWAKQLLVMVESESDIETRLKRATEGETLLLLSDLEAVEKSDAFKAVMVNVHSNHNLI